MATVVCCIKGTEISGEARLSQASPYSPTIIDVSIKGLPEGKHGISINVFGDLSDGFLKCGPHYNPMGKQHGDQASTERHVGSLGNIQSDGKVATLHLEDPLVQIIGPYSVIGRSILVYENEDDLGKGSSPNSLINGNVGNPIAGGVIGIANSL